MRCGRSTEIGLGQERSHGSHSYASTRPQSRCPGTCQRAALIPHLFGQRAAVEVKAEQEASGPDAVFVQVSAGSANHDTFVDALVDGQGVAGSNPVSPTRENRRSEAIS
jgi:hypothetical protein